MHAKELKTLMYIVDSDFNLKYMNDIAKKKMPNVTVGVKCYKEIAGLNSPCKGCPLVSGLYSNNAFYNKVLNEWFVTDACESSFDDKRAYILLQKPIANSTKDIFSNILKDQSFDVLAELDLDEGSFRVLKSHPILKNFESGRIDDLSQKVAQDYVEGFDYYRFKKFIEVKNIKRAIEKSGKEGLKEIFRLKSFIKSAEWVQIEILPKNMADDFGTRVLVTITFISPDKLCEVNELSTNISPLTGLLTGPSYLARAEAYINRHKHENLCIASIDIDHFKIYNEWYGATAGDVFLTDIGNRLKDFDTEYSSFSGYLGNDNFCIIIPQYKERIDTLCKLLVSTCKKHGDGAGFLPAIGVYPITDNNDSISKMFDRANIAASTIKDGHANRVSVYSSRMLNEIESEYKLIHDVMNSIKNDEFVVYYQPKCSIETGKIFGAEALVRWPKDGRIIPPNDFIPVLERTGSIVDLDTYVWEKTIMWLRSLLDRNIKPVPISVNVSRIDLFYLDVVSIFKRLVEKHNVPASLIELEITESAYVERLENIQRMVDELRMLGFKIALDDFGAGYSSLNVLKNITVDTLKLDIKFLDLQNAEKKGISILESVINMINSIDLKIVCEGVETKEQVEILKALGCLYVQGFYFFKPMPVENFEQFLVIGTNIDYSETRVNKVAPIKFNEFLGYLSHSDTLINNILGPVAFFMVDGENVEILQVNDKYSEITGLALDNSIDYKNAIKHSIYYDDLEKVGELFNSAIKNPIQGASNIIRYYRDKTLGHVEIKVFYLGDRNENKLFYSTCRDCTEDALLDERIKLNNKKLIETLRLENVDSWEYDCKLHTLKIFNPTNKELIKMTKGSNIFYDFPNTLLNRNYIDNNAARIITDSLAEAKNNRGSSVVKFDLPLNAGGEIIWLRCQCKAVENLDEVILIVGSYRDITNEVISASNEINKSALDILKDNSIYSSFVSLTKNIIYSFDNKSTIIGAIEGESYDKLHKMILSYLKDSSVIADAISRETLLEKYRSHMNLLSFDVRCNVEGIIGKRRLTIYMYGKADEVFAYLFIGEPDRNTKNMLKRSTKDELCDSLACGIIRFDYETKDIISANKLALEAYGYKTIDGFIKDMVDLSPIREYEEDKPEINRGRMHLHEVGDRVDIAFRVFVDGKTKYLAGNEELILIDDRLVIQRVFVDNTASKLNDIERLAEDENKLKALINLANHNKSILIGINKLFVSSYTCDLNTNYYQAMKYTKVVSELIADSKTFDEYMLNYAKRYVHEDDRLIFMAKTSRDYIKKHINYEQDSYSLIYKRLVDNQYKWYKLYIIASSFDNNGKVDSIIFAIRDIDNDTKAMEKYERKVEYYKDLFLSSSVDIYSGMLLIELDTLKCSDIMFKDRNLDERQYKETWDILYSRLIERLDPQYVNMVKSILEPDNLSNIHAGFHKTLKFKIYNKGSEYRFLSTTIRILEYNDKKIATLFTIDLTEDIKALEIVKDRSEHDELTGLYNRQRLDDYKAHRYPSIKSCGLLFFDINDLKLTNDTLGHNAGDMLIKTAASSILSIERDDIIGFRYGGDEFIVIYENCTEEELQNLIRKWEDALIKCNSASKIVCSMSLGYTFTNTIKSIDELILEADKEMYSSKLDYKNKGNKLIKKKDTSRLSALLKYLDNDYLFIYEINLSEDRYRLLHVNDLVMDSQLLRGLSYTKAMEALIERTVKPYDRKRLIDALSIKALEECYLDKREISYEPLYGGAKEIFKVQAIEFEGGICKRVSIAKRRGHISFLNK